MLILTIRTDKPEAEIGLFNNDRELAYETWQAHRQLAETIHTKLRDMLESQKKKLENIAAIAVFKGPGSFTGLRIGISVANALADSLQVPIVATTTEDWREKAIKKLQDGSDEKQIMPEYGAPPHTTPPKH